jgi:predicted nucleic acid-binding protein
LTPKAGAAAQKILNAVPVTIIHNPAVRPRARALAELCNQERVYDSTCAALAELRHCEFWTADKAFYEASGGNLSFIRFIAEYSPG